MWRLFISNKNSLELGILIIRMAIGLAFMVHGFMKLLAGPTKWLWLGSQLAYFGITFLPTLWGLVAANIEFIGGICLFFGLTVRSAALLLSLVMVVALSYHLRHGDVWDAYWPALILLIVLIGLLIAGPGNYSFDQYLYNRSHKNIYEN